MVDEAGQGRLDYRGSKQQNTGKKLHSSNEDTGEICSKVEMQVNLLPSLLACQHGASHWETLSSLPFDLAFTIRSCFPVTLSSK